MIQPDPIVEEVRRVREAYAARFDFDLTAIYRDLKEQERRSGREFVSFDREAKNPTKPVAEAPSA